MSREIRQENHHHIERKLHVRIDHHQKGEIHVRIDHHQNRDSHVRNEKVADRWIEKDTKVSRNEVIMIDQHDHIVDVVHEFK